MLNVLAFVLGCMAIVPTLLSLSRSKAWWIRIWDFPRLQLCVLAFVALVLWIFGTDWLAWPYNAFTVALAAVLLFQGVLVWRYTPFAPLEVQQSKSTDTSRQLSLVVSGESAESAERDSALLMVARRVSGATGPVVVCGDLNDVAWSHSTRLFQKISGLLEPRKGCGFVSTFHARYPGFRAPIDHVFHSDHFRLVRMRRLAYVGSDHFPVPIVLSYEPEAAAEQEAPHADAEDFREADETL